jgi:hypothetical protein
MMVRATSNDRIVALVEIVVALAEVAVGLADVVVAFGDVVLAEVLAVVVVARPWLVAELQKRAWLLPGLAGAEYRWRELHHAGERFH